MKTMMKKTEKRKEIKRRRFISLLLAAILLGSVSFPKADTITGYTDVPKDSWAISAVSSAKAYGLMSGQGDGMFGYGKTITKAEFATILCNMMKWTVQTPSVPSFSDVTRDKWYYAEIETALANGAVEKTAEFLPDTPITREEMAVMFVRALGLADAAQTAEKALSAGSMSLPFTDVIKSKGFIAVAYDIGMINGITETIFGPDNTAKREEAAAMLTRVYEKYYGDTEFLHGFYAISSYSQLELTKEMDAVTLGWSSMAMEDGHAKIVTEEGQYRIPDGYELAVSYLEQNGTKMHLGVYMDASQGVSELLTNAEARTEAVNAIMEETSRIYEAVGENPYSGVTIDFEGLRGTAVKEGFNAFLTELSMQLRASGKTLYVMVQPALSDGIYFDGFDYRTIGSLADKVILMAHDYNPSSLDAYIGTEWHKNAALTPIGSVYYSIKAVTDSETGVEDKEKLVLAISFASVGWQLSDDGSLLSGTPVRGSSEAVYSYLTADGTERGFSQQYRNPYLKYETAEGKNIFLWYENEKSVAEKAALARMMGICGISVWRLGNVPSYTGYDVMESLK